MIIDEIIELIRTDIASYKDNSSVDQCSSQLNSSYKWDLPSTRPGLVCKCTCHDHGRFCESLYLQQYVLDFCVLDLLNAFINLHAAKFPTFESQKNNTEFQV